MYFLSGGIVAADNRSKIYMILKLIQCLVFTNLTATAFLNVGSFLKLNRSWKLCNNIVSFIK